MAFSQRVPVINSDNQNNKLLDNNEPETQKMSLQGWLLDVHRWAGAMSHQPALHKYSSTPISGDDKLNNRILKTQTFITQDKLIS